MPTMETVEPEANADQGNAQNHEQNAPGLHADAHPNAHPAPQVEESALTDEQRFAQIFAIIRHRHSETDEKDKDTFFKRIEELRKAMSHAGESFLNFKALLDTTPLPQRDKNNPYCHPTDLLHVLLKHSGSLQFVNGIALMKSGSGHNGHISITGNKVEYIKALDDKGAPAVFGMHDAYRMVLMAANNSHILNSGKGMKINGTIRERALLERAINDVNKFLPEARQIKVANPVNNVQYRMHTALVSQDIRSLVGDDLYITEPHRSFPDQTVLDSAAAEFAPPKPAAEEPVATQDPTPTDHDQTEPESASAESSEENEFAFDIAEPAPSQSAEPTETVNADAPSEDELTAQPTPAPEATESESVDDPTVDEAASEETSQEELDRVASLRKESSDIQDESLALSEAIEKENEFESMRHDLIMLGKEIAQSRDEDKVQQYTDLADDFLFRMSDDIRSNALDLEIFDKNNLNIHEYKPSSVFGINDTTYYVVPNGDNFKLLGFQVNGQQFELDGGRGLFNYMEKYRPVLDVERYMAQNGDTLSEISRQVGTASDGRPVFSYAAEPTEENPDDLHEYIYIHDDNNVARLLRVFKNGVETDNIHPDIPVQFATETPVMAPDNVFSGMESALGVATHQVQDAEVEPVPVVDATAAPVIDEPAEEQSAAEEINNENAASSAQEHAFVPENEIKDAPESSIGQYLSDNADTILNDARHIGHTTDGRPVFSYTPPEDEAQPDKLSEFIFAYNQDDTAQLLRHSVNGNEEIIDEKTDILYDVQTPLQQSQAVQAEVFSAIAGKLDADQDEADNLDMDAKARADIEGSSSRPSQKPASAPAAEEIVTSVQEEEPATVQSEQLAEHAGPKPVEEPNAPEDDLDADAEYVPYQPFNTTWVIQPTPAPSHLDNLEESLVQQAAYTTEPNDIQHIAPYNTEAAEHEEITIPSAPLAMPATASPQQETAHTEAKLNGASTIQDQYVWVRDNVIVPYHDHFKNKKVADLVDEINQTLEGRHAPLTIDNDELVSRLKADRLLQTKDYKSGERITKISSFVKYTEEYKVIVEGLINNRPAWLGKGFDSFESMVANIRHTTVDELDPVTGANPWTLWQRLSRDGVISVNGKGKSAIILEVHDGLKNIPHLNLKKDFLQAAAMPDTTEQRIKPRIRLQNGGTFDYITPGVITPAERAEFERAALGVNGNNRENDDTIMPPMMDRFAEERLDSTDHLPRYAAE